MYIHASMQGLATVTIIPGQYRMLTCMMSYGDNMCLCPSLLGLILLSEGVMTGTRRFIAKSYAP